MIHVTALGELLVDFTIQNKFSTGMRLFEQNPGGAPANVLVALSKLGLKTAFIGKIGTDMHGSFLKETLENETVNTEGLIEDDTVFTTLAFVDLVNGERQFSFARKPGADTCLRPEEVKLSIIKDSKIFHVGSLSLTNEPSKSATIFALEKAKEYGTIISYDPNYRALLWISKEQAITEMRSILPFVDVLKISDEETLLMTGKKEPESAAQELIASGIPLVVVTLGGEGCFVCTKEGGQVVSGFKCNVVDTTGAGDSFWGGFLHQLIQSGKHPEEVTKEEAVSFAHFANGVASLCVEKRGAIPAMPKMEEVEERIKKNSDCR